MQHRDTETQRKIRTLYLCASVLILLFGYFGFAEGTGVREIPNNFEFPLT